MKNSLLALSVFALANVASAQITVTQSDIAPLYTQVRVANDTTPSVTAGSPGANQTYNLAAMNNQRVDTFTFTLPQFTPSTNNHSNSNRAIVQGSGFAYVYATLDGTGLYLNATEGDPGIGQNVDLVNTPAETQLTFPSTFNTAFSNNFTTGSTFYYGQDPGIGITLDSVRLQSTVVKSSNIDGWGNVTTPAGTYACLRQNVKRANTDSIWGYNQPILGGWAFLFSQQDSNRVYTYWANAAGYPVAEVTEGQDLGSVTSASYLLNTALIGIPEAIHSSVLSIYPNPASENINFITTGSNVATIEIYDVTGNVIASEKVVNDNTNINVANFAAGMYFYRAIDANGNVLDRGKFNVAH